MDAHAHTHTWAGTWSIVTGGGGFNPDQLSSEARELYGTSENSSGVNRISSGVCPKFRLIHQNLDFQWQYHWMRRHQSIDTHSSVRMGPKVAAGFTLTGKDTILHELLCVSDFQKYHVIEIQEDPKVIHCSSQMAQSLKSTVLGDLCPIKLEFVF